MTEQANLHKGHHHDGKFEGQTKDEDKGGGKGDVVADPPVVGNSHVLTPLIEEGEDVRQDEEVGEKDPPKEESEANQERGPEGFSFFVLESGNDELEQEIEEEGKGDDDAGKKGQLHREHEGLRWLQGTHEPEVALGIEVIAGFGFEEFEGQLAGSIFFIR